MIRLVETAGDLDQGIMLIIFAGRVIGGREGWWDFFMQSV